MNPFALLSFCMVHTDLRPTFGGALTYRATRRHRDFPRPPSRLPHSDLRACHGRPTSRRTGWPPARQSPGVPSRTVTASGSGQPGPGALAAASQPVQGWRRRRPACLPAKDSRTYERITERHSKDSPSGTARIHVRTSGQGNSKRHGAKYVHSGAKYVHSGAKYIEEY
jgi:hypothetical protein